MSKVVRPILRHRGLSRGNGGSVRTPVNSEAHLGRFFVCFLERLGDLFFLSRGNYRRYARCKTRNFWGGRYSVKEDIKKPKRGISGQFLFVFL